jgi:hypothetical protein
MLAKRGGRESSIGALPELRLDHLEVEDAPQAPAAAERQADQELEADQPGQPLQAEQEREQRERPDERLVDPRRALVDDVGVVVGVRGPARHALSHYGGRSCSP